LFSRWCEQNDFKWGLTPNADIDVNDLLPENFNKAAALYELIQKLQQE
jgi:hypothetical protein